MRRLVFGLGVVVIVAAAAPSAKAQTVLDGGLSDPFFLYYGFFLPRQAAMAASQPSSLQSINALSAARQQNALTERAGLYDPIGGLGDEEFDPAKPFGTRGKGRRAGSSLIASGISNTNINGHGPRQFYNRTRTYYPGLRVGQSANSNVYAGRRRGAGMGMPGAGGGGGMGMPGLGGLGGGAPR